MKQLTFRQVAAGLPAVFLFFSMLLYPRAVFEGAQSGLLLWFQIVFPTLFPFMLVSGMMLSGGGLTTISRVFGRLFSSVFATSSNGAFAVISGFLCGYPMGAKIAADLVKAEKISRDEGAYLLSFCNNTSPAFIMNYIVWKALDRGELLAPTLTILFLVPVSLSFIFRRFYLRGLRRFPEISEKGKKGTGHFSFSVLDSCLSESLEGIVKVGLYIIFFSVLLSLLKEVSSGNPLISFSLPALEITNGILMIAGSVSDLRVSYPLILGLSSFGGVCALAQTQCMLKGTKLSIGPYIIQKLTAAAAASLTGIVVIYMLRVY